MFSVYLNYFLNSEMLAELQKLLQCVGKGEGGSHQLVNHLPVFPRLCGDTRRCITFRPQVDQTFPKICNTF